MPTIKIVNTQTGKEVEREMNAQELKQYEKDLITQENLLKEQAEKNAQKLDLLSKLGITKEEAQLLLS